jgi:hypothetical protein
VLTINRQGPVRVGPRLLTPEDMTALIAGRVDAIHLPGFATTAECAELLHFFTHHPRAKAYGTVGGILRLGTSLNDARKIGTMHEFDAQDVLCEAMGVNGALPRVLGRIAGAWPAGVETFAYEGLPLHRTIFRRMPSGCSAPHDDNISKELPDDPVAREVTVQLGVNLYLEMPSTGGELDGWRLTLTSDEYEALRSTEPGRTYGVRRDEIGPADWQLSPATGDVIVIRTSDVHAICESPSHRSTWGFFLGYRGDRRSLLVWS